MSILRLAQSPPPSVAATTTISKAIKSLRVSHSGALAVLDRGELVGVLSERDIVHRVVGKGLDAETTLVRDVMTADVETVGLDASAEHAFELMASRHIRHLVVLDEKGRPVGLLSHRTVGQAQMEFAADQIRSLQAFVGADNAGD